MSTLDGFGLQNQPQAVRAAAGILAYLREMQPAALKQLRRIHSFSAGEYMTLDESTRRNLELTETIRSGEVRGSLLDVLDQTLTPMGGRLLRRWLNQPLLDVDAINRRLDAVEHFVRRDGPAHGTARALRHVGDLERWTNRVAQGIALPRDLAGMRDVLRKVGEIRRLCDYAAAGDSDWRSRVAGASRCDDVLDVAGACAVRRTACHVGKPGHHSLTDSARSWTI